MDFMVSVSPLVGDILRSSVHKRVDLGEFSMEILLVKDCAGPAGLQRDVISQVLLAVSHEDSPHGYYGTSGRPTPSPNSNPDVDLKWRAVLKWKNLVSDRSLGDEEFVTFVLDVFGVGLMFFVVLMQIELVLRVKLYRIYIRASKGMTEQEAKQILGMSEKSTWEDIVKKYVTLYESNAKTGSFYLQLKVHRAKERRRATKIDDGKTKQKKLQRHLRSRPKWRSVATEREFFLYRAYSRFSVATEVGRWAQ